MAALSMPAPPRYEEVCFARRVSSVSKFFWGRRRRVPFRLCGRAVSVLVLRFIEKQ